MCNFAVIIIMFYIDSAVLQRTRIYKVTNKYLPILLAINQRRIENKMSKNKIITMGRIKIVRSTVNIINFTR